jgi:signal transduction histidine kinase
LALIKQRLETRHYCTGHRTAANRAIQSTYQVTGVQQISNKYRNIAVYTTPEGTMLKKGKLWMADYRSAQGDRLLIEIIDNGTGVKELPRVFDPLCTTKPVGKGTGLGLSICYGIVTKRAGFEQIVRN